VGITRLELINYRIFERGLLEPDPHGTTVLVGFNGTGKTSVLEAIGYLATARSFRGATRDHLIRQGIEDAYLHATVERHDRPSSINAQISRSATARMTVNQQPVRTRRDLADVLAVTTFAPEDINVVRGGPAGRRDVLDDALVLLEPTAGGLLETVDRVLRQRNALLKQAKGRLTPEIISTLEVWDERLQAAGTSLIALREALVDDLRDEVQRAYAALAGAPVRDERATMDYERSFTGDLGTALLEHRDDDARRIRTGVGPHRDDLRLEINTRDARTEASQGEQRCLALALRLAIHQRVSARLGTPPVLLLDDVFSELDPDRSRRLVNELPEGQTIITSAVPLPSNVTNATVVAIEDIGGGRHGSLRSI